ncbi:hypothetical protein RB195_015776 [Necator americanus]|uniref:IBR domain protein n=1 Tax=Necator americanus TaxID=51031 RepID=A0ABR1E8T0_NECAM
MSLCEDEAYHHDYEKLVTKGSYLRSRRSLHQQRRRSADNAILTKTLLDPAGVLSKKQKNRLLSARDNDFQFDVPYSLNKHCRWETVNPKSLLLNSTEFDHDVLVADAVANSSCSEPALDYRVQKVHLLDDDALTTLSTTGKAKELAFFNEALREWKDKPKDEPDTARIQFNIIKNSSSHHPSPMSPKRRKRKPFTARKLVNDVELHDYYSDESCVDDDSTVEGEAEEYELPSLALSDFITESCSCGANHVLSTPTANTQPSPSGKVELECLTPLELADISQAIRMDCIFKVLDIKRSQLKPFDLHEKVSSLVPNLHHGQFVVHWFDKTRVSISNQPLADIVFIIFFELKDNLNTLRCRINTNTQYSQRLGEEALNILMTESEEFDTLLNELLDFIWRFTTRPALNCVAENNNRIRKCAQNYKTQVNSNMMAVVAESPLCRTCHSSLKTDLFQSVDGVMCKDCIASEVLHQLRLKQFPVRISLVTAADCSPLDLLYAILPVPVMSSLIKMSFSYFYALQNSEAIFTQCPQCSISLVINAPNEFNCCICPYCECYWCYRCCWEPHWPMSCQEFKEWSQDWDEQYHIERLHLDDNEKVLRITCACSYTFYAPESTAHGTHCPNKKCGNKYRFDKNGLMRSETDLWWWYRATERKRFIEKDGKMVKWGMSVEPQCFLPKRVIKKDFAAICADARDLRFNVKKQEKFKGVVMKTTECKSEQNGFMDTRRTELMSVERMVEEGKHELSNDVEHLQKEVLSMISAFQKALKVIDEAHENA